MPDFHYSKDEIFSLSPRKALKENKALLGAVFMMPENKDIVIKEFEAFGFQMMISYIEGLIDTEKLSESVLRPLIGSKEKIDLPCEKRMEFIKTSVLYAPQASSAETFLDISREMLSGICVLFIDGCGEALFLDLRKVPHRPVNRTNNESVVLGSQEGFVENLRMNISLIRKNLRSPELITEIIDVGSKNKTKAALMYVNNVTDPQIVNEARRRLKAITEETLMGTGQIQQLIEDHPLSLFPQILQTERPDRAAAGLSEGQFAILTDNSPYALMGPATIFHFLHASDDSFMRWQYGTFVRLIRMLGILFSLLLPGMYIALTQFHSHLLPMNLISSIAEARANVPFSILGEILFMEFSFHLINEAGTRIPSQIGSALGIVGALILGQAAVSANIASPILIIIVAITGLGNFVIPSYSLSIGLQIYRLLILFAGAVFGLYGIVLALFLMTVSLCAMCSFGAPYVSPLAPKRPGKGDVVLRVPFGFKKSRAFFERKVSKKHAESENGR
ncbi:MAG: spore germination protein [Clostridia bacterium]|nr:spore germination protein [Clostridia bacterium]